MMRQPNGCSIPALISRQATVDIRTRLNERRNVVDTSALLRFLIFGCCSQCYSFCWLIHVTVLLVAIEHCNDCFLGLLWFSHISSILVDFALTVKLTRQARTSQTVFALYIPVLILCMPAVPNSFGVVGHIHVSRRFCAGQTILHIMIQLGISFIIYS